MRSLFFFLFYFSTLGVVAQVNKGMSIEGHWHIGKIIKHNSEVLWDAPSLSTGYDLSLTFQTYGKKAWNQFQRYPKIGIGFQYFNFGDRDTLGNAYSLRYNFTLDLIQRKQFGFQFQFGSGFAWLDRPFDRIDNPANNAIGSKLNIMAHLNFTSFYRFSPEFQLNFGASFTHFSNGASQLPNLGINVVSGTLGLVYVPNPRLQEEYEKHDVPKRSEKKIGLRLEYSLGFRESQVPGGPRYPIKNYSLSGVYHLNKINRVFLGAEYEYNRAAYVFGDNVFAFNSDREAFWGASRIAVFAADEFVFGDFGMALQAGVYLGDFSYLVPNTFYFKVIGRYYVPILRKPATRAFVGVVLKSHLSVAEYFALNLGLEF